MSHLFNFTSDRWGFVVRTHMRDQNAPETAVYSESEPRLCMRWSPKSYRLVHRGVTKYNMRIKNVLTTKVCTRRHFVNIKNISLTRCNRHIERIVRRTFGIIIPIKPLRNACKTCLAIWCQILIGFISHYKIAEEKDMYFTNDSAHSSANRKVDLCPGQSFKSTFLWMFPPKIKCTMLARTCAKQNYLESICQNSRAQLSKLQCARRCCVVRANVRDQDAPETAVYFMPTFAIVCSNLKNRAR